MLPLLQKCWEKHEKEIQRDPTSGGSDKNGKNSRRWFLSNFQFLHGAGHSSSLSWPSTGANSLSHQLSILIWSPSTSLKLWATKWIRKQEPNTGEVSSIPNLLGFHQFSKTQWAFPGAKRDLIVEPWLMEVNTVKTRSASVWVHRKPTHWWNNSEVATTQH